jgi:glutaredoxin 3
MKVTIYSTPTCPYCIKAKEYFKEKKVEYTDYDVSTDEAKRKEMIEKSVGLSVPVIVIGDNIITGFDQAKIEEVLSKK